MKKFQQIACILGIIVLVGLYVLSLVAAIFYNEGFEQIFTAAIYSTIVIPVILYAILLFARVAKNKHQELEIEDEESSK